MCQLSYIHTKDNELNKLLFLLLGSFGSTIHNDGWGMVNANGDAWKCDLPMGLTTNAGSIVEKTFQDTYSPLMGHIRLASASVPVTTENAHPFRSENGKILFMHNGTLKPKVDKDFVLEYDVEETNAKGVVITKKVKFSDSLIFFQKFQEIYKDGKTFVDALKETMELFYGKFAFMFYDIDSKKFHIARGSTADLHITYILDKPTDDAQVVGYVINTNKDLLELCTNMLSNISQLQRGKSLFFSKITLLDSNTIFEAEDLDIVKVGEMRENYAPVSSHAGSTTFRGTFWENSWNETKEEAEKKVEKKTVEARYADTILSFMEDFCLSFRDVQFMFMEGFQTSMLEVTEPMVRRFCEKVIPNIRSLVPREVRKKVKSLMGENTFSSAQYANKELELNFPWMINDAETIRKLILTLDKDYKEAEVI